MPSLLGRRLIGNCLDRRDRCGGQHPAQQRDVEQMALISDSGGGAYSCHLCGSGRLAVAFCLQPRRRGLR